MVDKTENIYPLPAALTIAACEGLLDQITMWYGAQSGAVSLQGDQVLEVDAAGVQLLLVLWKTAQGDQRSFALHEPSPVLVEALEMAGVGQLLTKEGV